MQGALCFGAQFVGRYNEYGLRHRIGDVNHSQVPSATGLTERNPGSFSACSILQRPFEYVCDFLFRHVVFVNVRGAGFSLSKEPQFHSGMIPRRDN